MRISTTESEKAGNLNASGTLLHKYSSCSFQRELQFNSKRTKKRFKNEQRSRDAAAKKRANTSGVGKIINYCEDIYIPPYNNTH